MLGTSNYMIRAPAGNVQIKIIQVEVNKETFTEARAVFEKSTWESAVSSGWKDLAALPSQVWGSEGGRMIRTEGREAACGGNLKSRGPTVHPVERWREEAGSINNPLLTLILPCFCSVKPSRKPENNASFHGIHLGNLLGHKGKWRRWRENEKYPTQGLFMRQSLTSLYKTWPLKWQVVALCSGKAWLFPQNGFWILVYFALPHFPTSGSPWLSLPYN